MTEENITLAELLQKSGDRDFLKTVAEAVLSLPDGVETSR